MSLVRRGRWSGGRFGGRAGGAVRTAAGGLALLVGCASSAPLPEAPPVWIAPDAVFTPEANPTPPRPAEPTPPYVIVHTVAVGDSLSSIARRYGVSVAKLANTNGIENRGHIRIGSEIRILIEAEP